MSVATPVLCAGPGCKDSSVSFSDHCWAHSDHAAVLSALAKGLKNAKEPLFLHLKKADLRGLDFSRLSVAGSSFSQAKLTDCLFVGTDLSGADFIGTRLSNCEFVGSDLLKANFTRAVMNQCSFSYSDLRGAYFVEARARETDFLGSLLHEAVLWHADLSLARHLKKKNFHAPGGEGHEEEARIGEEDPLAACESYRALKHYFYANGLPEDASWAAYRELTTERKYYFRSRDPRFIPSLFMDLLSGYTEKPSRVIVASLAIVFIFALIYFAFNVPMRPESGGAGPATIGESLYFSFITFTTVGYGDYTPRPFFWFRLLACIEAFSGPFMAGLYIFTLTRRYAAV